MLNEKVRNYIVGLTMIAGILLFVAGIATLGQFSLISRPKPYPIAITPPNAANLNVGNKVDFNGVGIGLVRSVTLSADKRSVHIILDIDDNIEVPSNAIARVGKQTIGSAFVSLSLPEDPNHSGQYLPPAPPVAKDGTAMLKSEMADTGLIPKSVLDKISKVGDDLDQMLAQRSLSDFEKEDPAKRIANISILVQRLDRVAKGLDVYVGDPKTQEQFRQIMANLDASSNELKSVLANANNTVTKVNGTLDDFSGAAKSINSAATQATNTLDSTRGDINRVADKLVTTLDTLQKTVDAIAKGQGTTGKLVNDPRLYDGLVDLTKSLKTTSEDLNFLLRKWKEEGVNLNLK